MALDVGFGYKAGDMDHAGATAQHAGRVYLVDDDPRIVLATRRLLERCGHVVEGYTSPTEFLALARPEPPCCVLLDLDMPGMGGLEVQEALARSVPEAAVVFVSAHGDVPSSVRAMKAGAADFLTKPVGQELLLGTVDASLRRSAAQSARRAERVAARERLARLTPRERQVAELLVLGLRNRAIGERLGATEKTVKVHRGRVLSKVGVGSVAELVGVLDLGSAGRGT